MLQYCYQIIYVRRISGLEIISVFQICVDLLDPKFTHLQKVDILTLHNMALI